MTHKIAYLDCHSGISGDMLLGSLLDASLSFEILDAALMALPLDGYNIKHTPFQDQGITGSRFEVILTDHKQPTRSYTDIVALLQASTLPLTTRERAIAIFHTLGDAEATIHGVSLDEIHFHEVGAIDAIIDIVGACIALDTLEISQVYASPLPLTRGHMRMAHGIMPLPAPATLEILSKVKAPWVPTSIEGELVTPTGAAILATVARFELPAIIIEQVGYGFGQKRLPWPNCLRACIGTAYNQPYHELKQQEAAENRHSEHNHHHEHEHDFYAHTHNHT
jgi:pyridinium-3,5-bisthiocarboxylic acid mononucleotide nickel chelatase